MTWSILFILSELAFNKAIASEIGIVVPILILFSGAVWQWHRHSTPAKRRAHS